MNRLLRTIPNCITLVNLTAGLLSIISSFRGASPFWGLNGWEWGAIFIGIGATADFLDGFFARVLKAYTSLGKELDSLCDLVTFGVAPALLAFNVLEAYGAPDWMKWGMLLVPPLAAIRLARFNIDTRQTSFFIGVPVPANAIFWIGFSDLVAEGSNLLVTPAVFIPLLLLEAWLMISPFKLMSLKFHDYKFKGINLWRYLLILTMPISVFCMGVGGLMWFIVFYVVLSLCVKVESYG